MIADFFPLKARLFRCGLGLPVAGHPGGFDDELGKSLSTSHHGRVKVKIQGDPTLSKSQVSFHCLARTLRQERQGLLLELQALAKVSGEETPSISTFHLSSPFVSYCMHSETYSRHPWVFPHPVPKNTL